MLIDADVLLKWKARKQLDQLAKMVKITNVEIGSQIGSGHFGEVYKGFMEGMY